MQQIISCLTQKCAVCMHVCNQNSHETVKDSQLSNYSKQESQISQYKHVKFQILTNSGLSM